MMSELYLSSRVDVFIPYSTVWNKSSWYSHHGTPMGVPCNFMNVFA